MLFRINKYKIITKVHFNQKCKILALSLFINSISNIANCKIDNIVTRIVFNHKSYKILISHNYKHKHFNRNNSNSNYNNNNHFFKIKCTILFKYNIQTEIKLKLKMKMLIYLNNF